MVPSEPAPVPPRSAGHDARAPKSCPAQESEAFQARVLRDAQAAARGGGRRAGRAAVVAEGERSAEDVRGELIAHLVCLE